MYIHIRTDIIILKLMIILYKTSFTLATVIKSRLKMFCTLILLFLVIEFFMDHILILYIARCT